jgi:hypothetical protein
MSVTEIGLLHARYVRLSDRFKSIWTYHQFASGVFKNILHESLPYNIDFQKIYDRIKSVSGLLNAAQVQEAGAAITLGETALDRTTTQLLRADDQILASTLRRFFEKLKRQDETIIQFLIKFYLYSDATEGERRDKIDFLFTRIGEDFMAQRGEYWSRDSLEFRERVIALVAVKKIAEMPQDEVVRLIRIIRGMRDEISDTHEFEELTERNLLKNARQFKHSLGDVYFQPDVLLAIVELNVTAKNRFLRLYHEEEQRIVEDSTKLLEHGAAIERNFGGRNPELLEEIARFREFKERFDELRKASNVKHDVITHLKQSMSNILSQLDRGLGEEEASSDLPPAFFTEAEQKERVTSKFAGDRTLQAVLLRIAQAIDAADRNLLPEEIADLPHVREMRLESWEVAAYEKLFDRRNAESAEDNEDLWMLYVRAAALRIKVDEEATLLAASTAAGVHPENELLARAKQSLDTAKELDEEFGEILREAVYYSNPRMLRQLYRSRFRLLRGFSGLWLIYDRGQTPATA